ncbi:MAG: sigma-70 family RNA polymerase sigma factor [Candidatus Acidiferrum sp.]
MPQKACTARVAALTGSNEVRNKFMESPTSTLGLVERIKGGDSQAFGLLFGKYRRRLALLIYCRMSADLRGYTEVDDILQETFLAASRQLDQFRYQSPGSFMAWLARIANHTVVDAARFYARQKRDGGQSLRFRSESNPGGPEPAEFNTPSRIFMREERIQALLEKMNALSLEQREVVLLAKFEGLSTAEIATRSGKSREAIALLLHRALKRLRESAGEQHDR